MSDKTKYYYLKLKDNFYDRTEIKAIEGMESGYEYICLIQKMYLRSLPRNGQLMLTDLIPYDIKTLSSVLNHKQETVKAAIDLFIKFGLVEILSNSTIYMMDIQSYIGNSSSEADRIRNYRNKISNKSSTESVQMYDISTPEIKDKRLDREINSLLADKPACEDGFLTAVQQRKKDAEKLFDYYCEQFRSLGKHPKKTADKLSKIEARLKAFNATDCRIVIEHCRHDAFLCGSGPNSKFYAFVDYIFRSDEHFEKLLDSANNSHAVGSVKSVPLELPVYTEAEFNDMTQVGFVELIRKSFMRYDIGSALAFIKSSDKEISRELIWQWHIDNAGMLRDARVQ